MRSLWLLNVVWLVGCAGRVESRDSESTTEQIAVDGSGGATTMDSYPAPDEVDDVNSFGGMGGTCFGEVAAIEVPEDHCIRIEGTFHPGLTSVAECAALSCDDLTNTNVSLWRGWGGVTRYVHHDPACGPFDYEITPGPCD